LSIYFGIPAPTVAAWIAAAVAVLLIGLLVFAAVNRVLLKMALRNIPRRRAQTVLILFGLMLATLIITASLSVGDTLNYSLAAIQLRQIGGIDEAFTRHQVGGIVQGASTANSEFFSEAQAADVIARSKKDANVAAAEGVIGASGSMIDTTTSQSSSENVAIFGVPADFGSVWGQLHSSSGANLDVATLAPTEVFVGDQLGTTLNAHPAVCRLPPHDGDDPRGAGHRGQPEHFRPRPHRQLRPDASRNHAHGHAAAERLQPHLRPQPRHGGL
jgi:putative ABC transport system permease protein